MKPAAITVMVGVCILWSPIIYWALTALVIFAATLVVCVVAFVCGFPHPLDLFADTVDYLGTRFRKYFNVVKMLGTN